MSDDDFDPAAKPTRQTFTALLVGGPYIRDMRLSNLLARTAIGIVSSLLLLAACGSGDSAQEDFCSVVFDDLQNAIADRDVDAVQAAYDDLTLVVEDIREEFPGEEADAVEADVAAFGSELERAKDNPDTATPILGAAFLDLKQDIEEDSPPEVDCG